LGVDAIPWIDSDGQTHEQRDRAGSQVKNVLAEQADYCRERAESILELKEWMGHANVQTTMRYLHYKSKGGCGAEAGGGVCGRRSRGVTGAADGVRAARESPSP